MSDLIRGDIETSGDVVRSVGHGIIDAAAGEAVSTVLARAKAIQINNMTKSAKKQVFKTKMNVKQGNVNAYCHDYSKWSLGEQMEAVKKNFTIFKLGIPSTIGSNLPGWFWR